MENPIISQCPELTAYDYRMYDRIWQRVSPDLDPYPEVRAAMNGTNAAMSGTDSMTGSMDAAASAPVMPAAPETPAVPVAVDAAAAAEPAPTVPVVGGDSGEAQLPGAQVNPCCMGTEARESLAVLEGFIEEELAERRYCLTLCRRVRSQSAARLLRRIAAEKQAAAREMSTAYFLITGSCYTPVISVEQMQWENLTAALRSCYHQEACNGFNYERAAEGTVDPCLQKLFNKLSEQSYRRADDVMALLGQILC